MNAHCIARIFQIVFMEMGMSFYTKDIYSSIANDTPHLVGQQDCLQSIRLLHSFYRSDEKNGWQKVDEDGESVRLGRENNKISKLYGQVNEKNYWCNSCSYGI